MNKKTKVQQLGITNFPYCEYDKNGKMTYFETSNGVWWKNKYDKHNNNKTYIEYSNGSKEYTIR